MRIVIISASICWILVAACATSPDAADADWRDLAGRVHGLWDGTDGVALRLQGDGIDARYTAPANGAFRFGTALAAGSRYTVSVIRSPAQHSCIVEHGGSGAIADDGAAAVSVACKGPDVAIALSGAWGWTFDPTQEVQTLSGPVAAQDVAFTLSGAAALQGSLDGAALTLGQPSAPIALPLGSRPVAVSFRASGGMSKTYQLVFERAASVLAQVVYGKASNPDTGDRFGGAISLSGDTLAVGAAQEDSSAKGVNGNQADNSASSAGAVYVFVRSGTTWAQQAYLKASNTNGSDTFGSSVSLSGDTLAVGAPGEASASATNQSDNTVFGAGAVYVFQRSGAQWAQQAYLKASNIGAGDRFGTSVALSQDTLAVGAPNEASSSKGINGSQNESAPTAGAVYVLQRSGTQWAHQAFIKASNTDLGDRFGSVVALSGDTLAVQAFGEGSAATGINGDQTDNSATNSGAVYVFRRVAQTWAQQAYVKASHTVPGMAFGNSLALSGDTLAVGANHEDLGGPVSGAAYVYVRSGTTWSQQAVLQASNVQAGDFFGDAIAISGDLLVVGAGSEASSATGVNGDQSNNAFPNAGAAYLFARSGVVWTQQAYLKASNTHLGVRDRLDRIINDMFGTSVAVSGTTVVVGALFEFGGSAGINGNQNDRSKQQSGAIYIFQQ
jgi:hypothetical protein